MHSVPFSIDNVSLANTIILLVFLFVCLVSIKKQTNTTQLLSHSESQELKGFAILTILASHIGYSLTTNPAFLFPLSSLAGVGVDIFLFLSGYGLTISQHKAPLSIQDFYKKRFLKILVPFWCVLIFILLGDFLVHGITYSTTSIIQSFLVWFPSAQIWSDINSPFWYMTWIMLMYLCFPWFYNKKHLGYTALMLFSMATIIAYANPFSMQASWLHSLHTGAFSLGIIVGGWGIKKSISVQNYLSIQEKLRKNHFLCIISLILLGGIAYCIWGIHAAAFSENEIIKSMLEQGKSLVLAFICISIIAYKNIQLRFLSLLGVLSYEIYLIHWPLLARYDIFYPYLNAGIATCIWVIVLIGIAKIFQKLINSFSFFYSK